MAAISLGSLGTNSVLWILRRGVNWAATPGLAHQMIGAPELCRNVINSWSSLSQLSSCKCLDRTSQLLGRPGQHAMVPPHHSPLTPPSVWNSKCLRRGKNRRGDLQEVVKLWASSVPAAAAAGAPLSRAQSNNQLPWPGAAVLTVPCCTVRCSHHYRQRGDTGVGHN